MSLLFRLRTVLPAGRLAPAAFASFALFSLASLALGFSSACSLLNAPDDVIGGPSPTTGAGGSGGMDGPAGAGGAGGAGGTGGSGGAPMPAVCRNGVLEAGEECDDGNSDMGDACSTDCKITEFDIEADPTLGNEWPGIGTSGVDGGKGFFVIWRYLGDPHEIRGRAYKANGQRATQSPVRLSTGADPDQARIVTTPEGRSIVSWRSFADNSQVHYRVVEPDGKAKGTDDEFFPGSQSNALVSVGANSAGKLALMWMAEGDPSDPADEVRVRAFDETGSAAATTTQVLALTNTFGYPGVWGLDDGFVASWNSDDGKLGSMQVDNLGVSLGSKFSLAANVNANRNPFGAFVGPTLQFIAVFEQDIDLNGVVNSRITKRLFDAPGVSNVLEDLVSIKHTYQYHSRVAHYTNGKFVIVWADEDADNMESCNIVARVFNPDGTPLAPEFTVNQVREGCQSWPGVAVNSDGDAMFVWDNNISPIPYHISAVIIPRLLSDLPK